MKKHFIKSMFFIFIQSCGMNKIDSLNKSKRDFKVNISVKNMSQDKILFRLRLSEDAVMNQCDPQTAEIMTEIIADEIKTFSTSLKCQASPKVIIEGGQDSLNFRENLKYFKETFFIQKQTKIDLNIICGADKCEEEF